MALVDGLIAGYKLDGNANDVLGLKNGVDGGAVTYGAGKLNQAAIYSGAAGSATSIADHNDFDFTTAMSISCWFKSSTNTASRYFIAKPRDLTNGNGWDMGTGSTTNRLRAFTVGLSTISHEVVANIYDGNWHHIVFTFGSGTVKFYVNNSNTYTLNSVTGSLTVGTVPVCLGAFYSGGSFSQASSLDDVYFWNRALTALEVAQLNNNGNGLSYPFNNSSMFQFFL